MSDRPTTPGTPPSPASPPADEPMAPAAGAPPATPRRRRRWLIPVIAVAVLLGLYGAAYAYAGGAVPRGTTVRGVAIGGLSPAAAEDRLTAEVVPALAPPIVVAVGAATYEVVPADSGLAMDVPATVTSAGGGTANPVALVRALFGGGAIEPVVEVDERTLERAVESLAGQIDTEPADGAVGFEDGKPSVTDPVPGVVVVQDDAVDAIEDAYLDRPDPLTLPTREVEPTVGADDVQRALTEIAQPAMSAPIAVVAGQARTELPPAVVGQALTLTPDGEGVLSATVDPTRLMAAAQEQLAQIGQAARDATIRIEGTTPVVVPGESGQGVDPQQLADGVLAALTLQGEARAAPVELHVVQPALTTEEAQALAVTQVVGEFTTYFPHADYRNVNIGTAARKIDNTLLEPGEVFSLNDTVGERTRANGFTEGTIISDGQFKKDFGGGVSQVATTTFNAMFFAGLEDVEHKPHSFYIDRYPMGREATVAWPSLDLAFKNNTPYGVVVDTTFSPSSPGNRGALTVRMWSSPYWTVETSTGTPYNFTSGTTVNDTSPECVAQGGTRGFDVTVTRVLKRDGAAPDEQRFFTRYQPADQINCVGG